MLNNTVRKYPRTLQEAFPQDNGEWFEHYKPEPKWYQVWIAIAVIAVALYWVGREFF
jgi:hypothetical protein